VLPPNKQPTIATTTFNPDELQYFIKPNNPKFNSTLLNQTHGKFSNNNALLESVKNLQSPNRKKLQKYITTDEQQLLLDIAQASSIKHMHQLIQNSAVRFTTQEQADTYVYRIKEAASPLIKKAHYEPIHIRLGIAKKCTVQITPNFYDYIGKRLTDNHELEIRNFKPDKRPKVMNKLPLEALIAIVGSSEDIFDSTFKLAHEKIQEKHQSGQLYDLFQKFPLQLDNIIINYAKYGYFNSILPDKKKDQKKVTFTLADAIFNDWDSRVEGSYENTIPASRNSSTESAIVCNE